MTKLTKIYDADIREERVGNQFVAIEIHVSDKDDLCPAFSVGFNSDGDPSVLQIDNANLDRFNIAEGFASEDIVKVAEDILEARYEIRRRILFGGKKIVFATSKGTIVGKILSDTGWLKPYPKNSKI